MPMQLAEARMSAEFINLHLLWPGGEGRWRRRWGERRREATRVPALFQPSQKVNGEKWVRKGRIQKKMESSILKYALIWCFLPSCLLQPDDSFPCGSLVLLGPGRLCHCCHGLALKAAQGWNPISTLPFAFQQSFQSLALDSLLWSGFRPLMNSNDGDKWWWHSPLTSGTCQWSLEFLMEWIEFQLESKT